MGEEAKWRVREWFPKLEDDKLQKLKVFQIELLRFNTNVNLISQRTVVDSDLIHFADSIIGSEIVLSKTKAAKIHDIGSGNGFPGIVMAILDPSREFFLVESDRRKAEFLKHIASRVDAKNITVLPYRVEELKHGSIEAGVNRGFANITKAILTCRKVFADGGEFFHFKGGEWPLEVASIPHQLCSTWNTLHLEDYCLPEGDFSLSIILSTFKAN